MKDKTLKELKQIAKEEMNLEFKQSIKKDELLKLMGLEDDKPIEKKQRDIDTIILHCSASDSSNHDDISVIRKWHVEERGWNDVGYHYFIKRNGKVQKGRPTDAIGAHAKGYNETSIGICVHGKERFTADSLNSLESLIKSLLGKFPTIDKIIGHCEVSDKSCPNYNTKRFKNLLNGRI